MGTACCNMHRAYPSRRSVAPEELDDDSGRKGLSSIGFCVKDMACFHASSSSSDLLDRAPS